VMSNTQPRGLVYVDKALYVSTYQGNQVVRLDPATGLSRTIGSGLARTVDGWGEKASFCHPAGLATDGKWLFVGESHCPPYKGSYQGHGIRQMDLQSEEVSTLVGPGPTPHVREGVGSDGSINWPAAMAYDSKTGTLLVADMWDNAVLQVD